MHAGIKVNYWKIIERSHRPQWILLVSWFLQGCFTGTAGVIITIAPVLNLGIHKIVPVLIKYPEGYHDDAIKWKHFPCHWTIVRGIHQSPVNSPQKVQWYAASMFSWVCAWTNGWLINRDAGDLNRHHAHYDVTIIQWWCMSIGTTNNKITTLWTIFIILRLYWSGEIKWHTQTKDDVLYFIISFYMTYKTL